MSSIVRIKDRISKRKAITEPSWERKRSQIHRGIYLVLGGILSIAYSIQPVIGFQHIYFYFSFWHVTPQLVPAGMPGGLYSIPVVGNTYEVLVPWFLIGLSLFIYGVKTLLSGIGYRNGESRIRDSS